ncbi:T9SS type A sorting domain-containing protein [uncultured Algibacter sp.]|uniref:T9SS type A sorting domain-containing protein n=1 Tax=uncultured Algibacter sp. TaxID=298659 RepID=UPI003216EBCE
MKKTTLIIKLYLNSILRKNNIFFLALFLSFLGNAQTTYYVDASRPDNTADGLSFLNAFKDLQNAIDIASVGDEIRVAQGTYFPTEPVINSSSELMFHLDKDLIIKGSYDTVTGNQDLTNLSILSGDFDNDNLVTGNGENLNIDRGNSNAKTVLITINLSNNCIIDGFEITGGSGGSASPNISYGGFTIDRFAGGMTNYGSSPTLTNVTFFGNFSFGSGAGAGMYNNSNSNPTLTDINFIKNYATFEGGGLYNRSSSPLLTNVLFSGNYSGDKGGGMHIINTASSPIINSALFLENFSVFDGGGISIMSNASITLNNTIFSGNNSDETGGGMFARQTTSINLNNVVFAGNSATDDGGGFYNWSTANVELNNVTFVRNSTGTDGAGMYNQSTVSNSPVLNNTVFYSNVKPSMINDIAGDNVDFSSKNNASDGTGGLINIGQNFINLTADPFMNSFDFNGNDNIYGTNDDGLIPNATNSVLANAGDNTKNSTTIDVKGENRIANTTIDIGAYESDSTLNIINNELNISTTIYPNPATNYIKIHNHSNKQLNEIVIYNMSGQLVSKVALNSSVLENKIDISNLQKASYFMIIKSKSTQETKLFIKVD